MKGSATKENGLSQLVRGRLKKPSCGQGDEQYLAGNSGEERGMSDWGTNRLGDVLQLNYGKSLPVKSRIEGLIPVYGSNGVVGTHKEPIVNKPGLIVGRKGSAGQVHYSRSPFCPIDTTFYVTQDDAPDMDLEFLFYFLRHIDLTRIVGDVGVPGLNREMAYMEQVCFPAALTEQKKIAHILSTVQRAIEAQERIIQTTTDLKKALMRKLFTEGLRNEPQKQTEIGPIPESWEVLTVESVCAIKASAMSYKQLEDAPNVPQGICVIGVKVSDMNLPGNEIELQSANLERLLSEIEALKRTVPENCIVFPKRGAAIATNKKRLTTGRTVLDPNLIAVIPSEAVNHRYLFHWFNTFDLKKITDPGPTPQLNKKDIAPLKLPMPSVAEQEAIATTIDTAELKTTLHRRKRDQFQDLFRTLLHELMTAKIRVTSFYYFPRTS